MNFPDVVGALIRRRKLILFNTGILTILAVVVSLLLPQRYTATAGVLPPPDDDPLGLTAQLSVGISGQLGRLRAGMLGGGTSSDLMIGILSSNTVMESVVLDCSIIPRYRVKNDNLQEAVRLLGGMTDLAVSNEGIVTIAVEARQPEWAAEIANSYVKNLDGFLRSSNINRGRAMRVFVEERLDEVRQELNSARVTLTMFQEEHKLAMPDEQVRGIVESYSEIYGDYLKMQAQLAQAEVIGTPSNPILKYLRVNADAYQRHLSNLLSGTMHDPSGTGFSLAFDSLPAIMSDYVYRLAEFKLLQESYIMLYQQFEHARIMEARDVPAITVLDYAVPPDKRSFPRRSIIVLSVALFSLAMGVAFVLVENHFRQLSKTQPDIAASWRNVRTQLRGIRLPFRQRKNREH